MIFVTLGTQDKPFDRIVKEIDELVSKKVIKEEVIIQCGSSNYKPQHCKIITFVPFEEFTNYIKKSSFIICHGGVGSILDGLKNDKKVIAVPRLAKYKEQQNDHQLQIIEQFSKLSLIVPCISEKDLAKCIKKVDSFTPGTYKSNNDNFVNLITNYIDNN